PRLQSSSYRVTSPPDRAYTCIAWSVGKCDQWWWPDPIGESYWPPEAPREETLPAFILAYAGLGFEPDATESVETGFEKVAIFVATGGKPTHAARQLPSGRWTSKLGRSEDIEHDLRDIEGEIYGTVAMILRRPIPQAEE